MDDLQGRLDQWLRHGGPEDPALDMLCREWRPIIRRFLQQPDEAEVEEALQQALLDLVLSRRIVSKDPETPLAWRRSLLKNHLTDRARRRGRRSHAEQAERAGIAPLAERRAWRQRQDERHAPRLDLHDPVGPSADAPATELELDRLDDQRRRSQAARALPALPVRGRVLLALCLGIDPSPWAEELAREVGGTAEDVLGRAEDARRYLLEHGPEPLPMVAVRVVYPDATDNETAKRTFRRAREALAVRLRGGE